MFTGPSSPLITIVIPTRDRPEFAALALKALSKQTFQDFEVVLSDNALHRPLEPDPRLFDGLRVRYVRPPKPMWMTDHWEFAVAQARGRYVGVLGDKSLLVSGALDHVAAEIRRESPEAVSWQVGVFQPSSGDLDGPGIATIPRAPDEQAINVPAADALEYLLATYLEPTKHDHQLEIRGSIYHGVFSAELLAGMRSRFGRVFRFYAPDLNAQCAAMQVARQVRYIRRPLELVMTGPSNGVAVGRRVSEILATQHEAASGDSGTSVHLIPGISTSIAHLLASDLMAVAGRTLRPNQWVELHARTAFDLHSISGWPDRSFERSQLLALQKSVARFAPAVRRRLSYVKWEARRRRARALLVAHLRSGLGNHLEGLWRALSKPEASVTRHRFDHLFAALEVKI